MLLLLSSISGYFSENNTKNSFKGLSPSKKRLWFIYFIESFLKTIKTLFILS